MTAQDERPVIVIGAGMAGLTAASVLHGTGLPVEIYEEADTIGGRVGSRDHADGYRLDRGFQMLSGAYPVLERHIDLESLQPRRFDRSVAIWHNKRFTRLATPFRHPRSLAGALRFAGRNPGDQARLARLALRAKLASWRSATDATLSKHADGSALELLQQEGFSQDFIDLFARPFWGGLTLDWSLSGNAGSMLFSLKMMIEGPSVLPARGMQALPDALASGLPGDAIRTNARVDEIVFEENRATGVRVAGETRVGRAVIVAADPETSKVLTGIESIPTVGIGCTTVYLAGDRDPGIGKSLLLDADDDHGVNHAVTISAVAPEYAPNGNHLMAAVLLDHPRNVTLADEALAQRARVSVSGMLGHRIEDWEAISTNRIPFAQLAQPPGFASKRPMNRTQTVGLYLAGEYTHDSSINGAMLSGENAAKSLLHDAGITTIPALDRH